MSRRFLGALVRRDLSEIRRALFLEPLLQRNTGDLAALRPEERDDVPGGQEERPAAEIELPPAALPPQVVADQEQEQTAT
ncbi:MAG TPA: hypothetical protein VLB00_02760 [Gemmatimonadales bacterium]|nr:hypothetical protein [Gemmatimonadales bacterium]